MVGAEAAGAKHSQSMALMILPRLARIPVRRFATLSSHDIAHFADFLPPAAILSTLPPVALPSHDLQPHNSDWMGRFHGSSSTVLKPKTTEQVSRILQWCNHRKIAVVPQGGNTGLVGGSVPVNDELVISLSNMNKVREFDPVSGQSPPPCPSLSPMFIFFPQVSSSQMLDVSSNP
jgi:hypothetical protein